MKIHDISLTISPKMPVWPGDPAVELLPIESMDRGAHANVSRLACGVHTGTHVDAPHHFLNDGRTVETLPLQVLTGPTRVIHLPEEVDVIDAAILESAGIPSGCERLLFKTRNSHLWERGEQQFVTRYVALAVDGASWLVQRGVRLVGVDYLSVAPFHHGGPVHRVLLQAGMVVVEGLDLSRVEAGAYTLYCLPLKIADSEGAPARVILVQ